ncbi:MAG: DUF2974 domain-containing protein [Coprobacillus sp.]|nr:DUF2974 domain-containing protein [Coprobacillus sp.]
MPKYRDIDRNENIITYVKSNDKTFVEEPLNERDALVFAILTYCRYENIDTLTKKQTNSITISELNSYIKDINVGSPMIEGCKILLPIISKSKRFKDIKISQIESHFDEEESIQYFSCIYIDSESKTLVVGYRGTDNAIAGWMEDLDLATKKIIPSDTYASEYLKRIIKKYPRYSVYLTGHSKGGNLVEYSLYSLTKRERKHIVMTYDFDGPNFDIEIDREALLPKIRKYVPKDCVVGKLLENGIPYQVVDSRSISVLQHDPFYWKLKNGEFILLDKVSKTSETTLKLFNNFVNKLTDAEKLDIVNTIKKYTIGLDQKTLTQVKKEPLKTAGEIIQKSKYIKSETDRGTYLKILVEVFRNS